MCDFEDMLLVAVVNLDAYANILRLVGLLSRRNARTLVRPCAAIDFLEKLY